MNPRDYFQETSAQEPKNFLFKLYDPVLCVEDLEFIFFQFFGDISLGVHECLFAGIIWWDFVLMAPCDFYVVAENPVVADS